MTDHEHIHRSIDLDDGTLEVVKASPGQLKKIQAIGFYADSRQFLIKYLRDNDLLPDVPKDALVIILPCSQRTYPTYDAIPATSDPCACGCGNWFIKYRDDVTAEEINGGLGAATEGTGASDVATRDVR